MSRVRFSGFGEQAIDFYDGLVADNTKAYWDDNREVYDADVKAPMEALLAELTPSSPPTSAPPRCSGRTGTSGSRRTRPRTRRTAAA
ncbi:hypothetical protein GCM10029964_100960 [Kibdelosporangium lantanae]